MCNESDCIDQLTVSVVSRLPRLIQVATSGLDANAGLLLSKKFDKNTIIIVLKQLEVLVHAYGDLKQTASDKQEVISISLDSTIK